MNDEILQSLARRMERLLDDIDEMRADLKEVELEAKARGLNVSEIKKWVQARRKDRVEKRIDDVAASVLYGEALGFETGFGGALKSDESQDLTDSNLDDEPC